MVVTLAAGHPVGFRLDGELALPHQVLRQGMAPPHIALPHGL